MNQFEVPKPVLDVIQDTSLSREKQIEAISLFATYTMDMSGGTLGRPLITSEQADLLIEAVKHDLFSNPSKSIYSMSITCNRCGQTETYIEDSLDPFDDQEEPDGEAVIAESRRYFNTQHGWQFHPSYGDLCPACAKERGVI